ncbi:MAG TPA: hypothetical protein VLF67_04725 [Candidatus Saccharimonas sp.]|nr:hypothetical protein [Candidatus Saccharimonas sp.]
MSTTTTTGTPPASLIRNIPARDELAPLIVIVGHRSTGNSDFYVELLAQVSKRSTPVLLDPLTFTPEYHELRSLPVALQMMAVGMLTGPDGLGIDKLGFTTRGIHVELQNAYRFNMGLYMRQVLDGVTAAYDRHLRVYLMTKNWSPIELEAARRALPEAVEVAGYEQLRKVLYELETGQPLEVPKPAPEPGADGASE